MSYPRTCLEMGSNLWEKFSARTLYFSKIMEICYAFLGTYFWGIDSAYTFHMFLRALITCERNKFHFLVWLVVLFWFFLSFQPEFSENKSLCCVLTVLYRVLPLVPTVAVLHSCWGLWQKLKMAIHPCLPEISIDWSLCVRKCMKKQSCL